MATTPAPGWSGASHRLVSEQSDATAAPMRRPATRLLEEVQGVAVVLGAGRGRAPGGH